MRRFTSAAYVQRFASVHGIVQNLFRVGRAASQRTTAREGTCDQQQCNEGWRRKGTSVERCLRNALKAAAPVGSTSAWAEVTASGAGRLCAEQNFERSAALGCIKVPSGASKSEIPVQMIQKCPCRSSFGCRSDTRFDLDDDPHTAPSERHRATLGPGMSSSPTLRCRLW